MCVCVCIGPNSLPQPPNDSLHCHTKSCNFTFFHRVQMGVYCKSSRLNSFVTKETWVENAAPRRPPGTQSLTSQSLPLTEQWRNKWRRPTMSLVNSYVRVKMAEAEETIKRISFCCEDCCTAQSQNLWVAKFTLASFYQTNRQRKDFIFFQ